MTAERGPALPLDRGILDELRTELDDDSGELVADIIESYVEQSMVLVEQMEHAAAAGDIERLGFAAHSLKGSSAGVGGSRLAALCLRLEHSQASSSDIAPTVVQVRDEVTALLDALDAYLP